MKMPIALAAAAVAFVASPANAATCQFTMAGTVTDPSPPYDSPLLASFSLDCSPVPTDSSASRFDISNVAGLFNGPGVAGGDGKGVGPITVGDLQFYVAGLGGGFEVNYPESGATNPGFGLFSLTGDQLFSGTTAAPTFLPGEYKFTNDYFYGDVAATLKITQLDTPAVPEPATWAMMVLGFGAIGTMLRRRAPAQRASLA